MRAPRLSTIRRFVLGTVLTLRLWANRRHRHHVTDRLKRLFILTIGFVAFSINRAAGDEDLGTSFAHPPDSARPRVWWHWIDGNVSKEGITADLEAMKRAGIGGAWIFNVSQRMPAGSASFLSPTWLQMFDHAVQECDRLGLELGIHNCDGWSEAGGPWISPELSMKKLTWTETTVRGPARVQLALAKPASRLGFYREVALLAIPAPRLEVSLKPASIRASFVLDRPQDLTDKRGDTAVSVPMSAKASPQWIELEYSKPLTVRSLSLATPRSRHGGAARPPMSSARLDAWTGTTWQTLKIFNVLWAMEDPAVSATTIAFDETRAQRFRITFFGLPMFELAEVSLSGEQYVHYWQLKAGWSRVREHGGETDFLRSEGPAGNDEIPSTVKTADVINLSGLMTDSGTLDWNVPNGEWIVYRIGLTTTGRTNTPATKQGVGLECDKLSRKGILEHFPHYVGRLAALYGASAGRALRVVETDSWECGFQNWTEDLPKEFRARRGYDIISWLPLILSGRSLDSMEASERVLWDFRRTLADMIRENFYETFRDLSHDAGLVYCGEGAGRQQYLYDPLNYQSTHDLPMGEFWLREKLRPDNRVAASVAHTYGRSTVAAEAYTGRAEHTRWTNDPFDLKALGDLAFCAGVNAFTFHRYAHQPWMHVAPGMTMGGWGLMLERTVTWWDMSRPWFEYLTRCQHLLRQGEFVADVCHYIGEDVPNALGYREDLWLPLPPGIDFDGCNDEILRRFTVRDGRLMLPHGQSYTVLLLPAGRTMRPDSLRVIRDLVRAGATVVGRRPVRSPSYVDMGSGDAELRRLADELWGTESEAMPTQLYTHTLGKGRVISCGTSTTWAEIAKLIKLRADFEVEQPNQASIHYIHRRVGVLDIYFIATDSTQPCSTIARFRVTGKRPQLWDPQSGEISELPEFNDDGAVTTVPLRFDPSGSCFVAFAPQREQNRPNDRRRNFSDYRIVEEVRGAWEVAFDPKWGGPRHIRFPALIDWATHNDDGIRYYSGVATYRKTVTWSTKSPGTRIWLNLGVVKNLAEVRLNGQPMGIVWKPPFRVDVTSALNVGDNELEIRVANLWVNRLIGDEQLPEDVVWSGQRPKSWPKWLTNPSQARPPGRFAFETFQHWKKDESLLPAGLLGPVTLEQEVP